LGWAEQETRRERSGRKPGYPADARIKKADLGQARDRRARREFQFQEYADLAARSIPKFAPNQAKRLLLSAAPCQNGGMPRIDRYDVIGIILLALVAALWIVHFSLPSGICR
jgi:hypothetical protein